MRSNVQFEDMKKNLVSSITMVKNEEEFVGYALMSAYRHVDQMVVVDGGSSDGTCAIIEFIIRELDTEHKITFWSDPRPKNKLILTRNDMLARCTGEWILRLEGDEVYTDEHISSVRRYLEEGRIHPKTMSAGWPYYFFAGNLDSIVPVGEFFTFATIMIRNFEGIHAAHHHKDGHESFYDEGWFDGDGNNVSIWHPRDNPTQRILSIGIHHYAGLKSETRHSDYLKNCMTVPFKEGQPQVFERYDFKPLMKHQRSRNLVGVVEQRVHFSRKKTIGEEIRKRLKGY
jgi:glycosyltransferase involved in cell wall biosynthesis